jgi:acetyl-CoA carboxylase carboxyltransferase component
MEAGVVSYAQTSPFFAGSVGRMHAKKICKVIDLAVQDRSAPSCPLRFGGGALQEGVDFARRLGEVMFRHSCSGLLPQIAW